MSGGIRFGRETRSRPQIQTDARGLLCDPFPFFLNPAVQAPTSKTVYGCLNGLRVGDVVSNIVVTVAQVAAGTAPTSCFAGLFDTTGARLAVSADLKDSAIWTTALGPVSAPLSSPYVVPNDGGYYAAIWFDGVFGTTALNLARSTANSYAQLAYGSNAAQHVIQTGQATFPSTATFVTTSAVTLWIATS